MEVVVLPPQDYLQRHHHNDHRRRNPNFRNTARSNPRRQYTKPSTGPNQTRPRPTGQVRILKRGDDVLKAEPGFYAGSAYVTSPPPSELPLPAFFSNNNQKIASDLRRVLKLC